MVVVVVVDMGVAGIMEEVVAIMDEGLFLVDFIMYFSIKVYILKMFPSF